MPLVLVLAGGCVRGFVLDEDALTCAEDPYDWGAGLTTHLVHGDERGVFDYDPEDAELARVVGQYDVGDGDFYWTERYVESSWRSRNIVDGFGTAWVDGDLDTEATITAELDDGTQIPYSVRDVRLGCEVDRTIENSAGRVRVYSGVFEDGGLTYTHTYDEAGVVVTADGRLESDGSFSETVDYDEDGIVWSSNESGTTDGVIWRDYARTWPTVDVEGTWERRADGLLEVETVFDPDDSLKETWTYTLDASGSGEGSLDVGRQDVHCDLLFEDGVCTQQHCVELADGPCMPPVAVPMWLVRL